MKSLKLFQIKQHGGIVALTVVCADLIEIYIVMKLSYFIFHIQFAPPKVDNANCHVHQLY